MTVKWKKLRKKYFNNAGYGKFTSEKLDAKIKQKELVNKFDISNLEKLLIET